MPSPSVMAMAASPAQDHSTQGTKRAANPSQTPSKRIRLPSTTQSTPTRRAPSTQQIQRAQLAAASVPQTYFVDKHYEAKSRASAARATDCWYFVVGTHYESTYQPSQNEILSLQQSDQARLDARPLNLSHPAGPRLRCTECMKLGRLKIWKNSDEGGVSKGIRKHLKKYHAAAYGNACRKIGYADTNESEQAEDVIDEPITPEGILRYLLEWIAEDDLPFNIVTHKGFRRFVSYIGQGQVSAKDLPDRHTLSSKIEVYSAEQKALIKEELKRAPGLISCTSDLWSDETQRSFMCITVHFIDEYDHEADYLIAFRVIEGSHAGANLAETFFEVLEEFEIVEKLGMITLDNASNNDTLMAQLEKYMEARGMNFDRQGNRLRCFPHVVNLAVQDTVKALGPSAQHLRKILEESGQMIDAELAAYLDSLESGVLARCRETAVALRHGQRRQGLQATIREDNAKNIYRTHQVEDGVRSQVEFTMKPLELVLDCPTRWSSTRNMIDRFIYLYPAVSRYIASVPALAPYALSHKDLQVLQDIRTVLNHAHRTQELLSSSKTPTLGFALPAYYALLYQWKQLQQRMPALSHAIGVGISKIEEYVTKTRSSPVHMVAMALNPSIGYSWMRDNLSQEDALNAQQIVKDFMLQTLRRYQEQLRQQYTTSCAGLSRSLSSTEMATRSVNTGYAALLEDDTFDFCSSLGDSTLASSLPHSKAASRSPSPSVTDRNSSEFSSPAFTGTFLANTIVDKPAFLDMSPIELEAHNLAAVEAEHRKFAKMRPIPAKEMKSMSMVDYWKVRTQFRNHISARNVESLQILKHALRRRPCMARSASPRTLDFMAPHVDATWGDSAITSVD